MNSTLPPSKAMEVPITVHTLLALGHRSVTLQPVNKHNYECIVYGNALHIGVVIDKHSVLGRHAQYLC